MFKARIIFSGIARHNIIRRLLDLSSRNEEEIKDGLERKKERARKRAKSVRESAIIARRKRERTLTPGVMVIGSSIFDRDEKTAGSDRKDELRQIMLEYLLKRGGFQITEERRIDKISKKPDSKDVMEVQIARIVGLHELWGLDRKFIAKSIFAHRFENGTIFEHSLISYGGYVSRTYYVVEGNEFLAIVQHNFRKASN